MDNGASSYLRFLNGDKNGFVELVRGYKDGLTLFSVSSITLSFEISFQIRW